MKSGTSEISKKKPGRPAKITEVVVDFAMAEDIDPKKVIDESDLAKALPKEVPNFGLGVVASYEQYYHALDAARMRDIKFIEVTEPFFKLFTKGQKTKYVIVGDPAVFVYVVGSREAILAEEKLTADEVAGLMTGNKK